MRKEKRNKPERVQQGTIGYFFQYLHDTITRINQSKIFAGIMIIVLNIASRFVTIKLSKSMESYFKYTFSKQLLIFAIAWMGTRDIYIALIITGLFTLVMDCLLNEECSICMLPKNFTNYHIELSKEKEEEAQQPEMKKDKQKVDSSEEEQISDAQIKEAKETLEKAQAQKQAKKKTLFPSYATQLSMT
jgi:hypothetical protein